MWYNRTTGSLFLLKSITLGVAKWVETTDTDSLPTTSSTDPAIDAAVTTAIIDATQVSIISKRIWKFLKKASRLKVSN